MTGSYGVIIVFTRLYILYKVPIQQGFTYFIHVPLKRGFLHTLYLPLQQGTKGTTALYHLEQIISQRTSRRVKNTFSSSIRRTINLSNSSSFLFVPLYTLSKAFSVSHYSLCYNTQRNHMKSELGYNETHRVQHRISRHMECL